MNVKFKPAPLCDTSEIVDVAPIVPSYTTNEDGEVICVGVPENEIERVPQDGARLELKNLVKYEGQVPEEYIEVCPTDSLQTARAIERVALKHHEALKNAEDSNNLNND